MNNNASHDRTHARTRRNELPVGCSVLADSRSSTSDSPPIAGPHDRPSFANAAFPGDGCGLPGSSLQVPKPAVNTERVLMTLPSVSATRSDEGRRKVGVKLNASAGAGIVILQ